MNKIPAGWGVGISVVWGAILLELGLRLMSFQWTDPTHFPCIYQENAETGYRYIPRSGGWMRRHREINNYVQINSQGFHDVEHDVAYSGQGKRILVVGDSFVAANHVSVSEGWTQILQSLLNDKQAANGQKWEVINLGLDGIATDAEEIILKQYLDVYHPDIVLLAFYTNDIKGLRVKTEYRTCYRDAVLIYQTPEQKRQLTDFVDKYQPGEVLTFLYQHFFMVRAGAALIERYSYRIPAPTTLLVSNYLSPSRIGTGVAKEQASPRDLKTILFRMKALVEARQARFILLPVPAKEHIDRSYNDLKGSLPAEELDQFEQLLVFDGMEERLAKEGVKYRDLFWKYDGHFNGKGYRAFGEAVAVELERRLGAE